MDFSAVFCQIINLSEKYFPSTDKWTVLAAFVDENGNILSLAAGVKCLPINNLFREDGTKLSSYHDLIRDSHAEVLARRAFIRYSLLNPEKVPTKVWLFTSHVPCGDASISSCDDIQFGLARGKEEWSRVGCLRTKPGRGDAPPTHCLSCSDKILKWAHLGAQGKYLLNKVELSGIIIAGESDKESIERAILKRSPVDRPFEIVRLENIQYKALGEPAFEARAWHLGMEKSETIVQGRKLGSKKPLANAPLPQSSRSLFCDSMLSSLCSNYTNSTYEESKRVLFAKSNLFQFWPRVTDKLPESLQSGGNTYPRELGDENERKRPRRQ